MFNKLQKKSAMIGLDVEIADESNTKKEHKMLEKCKGLKVKV